MKEKQVAVPRDEESRAHVSKSLQAVLILAGLLLLTASSGSAA